MADLLARIKPKKSSTPGEAPSASDLEVSEIAVNTADGKLFTKHTDNTIKTIGGGGSTYYVTDVADPQWGNVNHLMTGDGATPYADIGNTPITFSGGQVTTSFSKWGTKSIDTLTGATDIQATMPAVLGVQNFTLEGWFYYDNAGRPGYATFLEVGPYTQAVNTIGFERTASTNNFTLRVANNSSTLANSPSTTTPAVANRWQHVAIVRAGNVFSGYVDGNLVSQFTYAASLGSQNLRVGNSCKGVNDVRLTVGSARYSGTTISVPSAKFDTLSLAGINGLNDVNTKTTPPTNNQVLSWNGSDWVPGSATVVRTLLGIGSYATDAAAGTGGVSSGALYYNTTSNDYRLKS